MHKIKQSVVQSPYFHVTFTVEWWLSEIFSKKHRIYSSPQTIMMPDLWCSNSRHAFSHFSITLHNLILWPQAVSAYKIRFPDFQCKLCDLNTLLMCENQLNIELVMTNTCNIGKLLIRTTCMQSLRCSYNVQLNSRAQTLNPTDSVCVRACVRACACACLA